MSDPVANQEFLKRFNVTITGCDGSLWHVSGDKAGSEGCCSVRSSAVFTMLL